MKKALGRMIENTIDNKFISDFLDDVTGSINKPLHEVLEYLYEYYGDVQRHDLKTVEREVDNMNYDLSQPPNVIWKAIDDLQRLAVAANLKYTDSQLVDLGLTIIKGTHDLETGQSEWYDKPTANKTYANLKEHFDKAYKKLQRIRGEDMRPSAHHHVNAMRININSSTNQLQDEMLSKVNALKDDILDAITAEKENLQPIEQSMSAATSVSTLTKLATVL